MDFDKNLIGKILDPIHGIIRLTALELEFVNHALFQRLRNIKQNTFLYKVFPSAMHSRFEHSLGAMHLSYEIIKNLKLNSYRYEKKYEDDYMFNDIDKLPLKNIQELRLAALLHDIGHGPMSHQFDVFMCKKEELKAHLGEEFEDVFHMIPDGLHIEHEHISMMFVQIIYDSLDVTSRAKIDIHNVMKIIESKYKDKEIMVSVGGTSFDVLPLFTSIISSCPIDADRMDYLLRDSYFSGVKCGVYDYNRLFMSIVPVITENKIFLAYKESGIDSVVEFINARSSLFGQVYYHKTNRAFSAMLANVCQIAKAKESGEALSLFDFYETDESAVAESKIKQLENFYIKNSDNYFLHEQLLTLISDSKFPDVGKAIINDINNRVPWCKIYESKIYIETPKVTDKVDAAFVQGLKKRLYETLLRHFDNYLFAVDIVTDNAFKDIDKTEVKLLEKNISNDYDVNKFASGGDKLNRYQSIKYFIRVFVSHSMKSKVTDDVIREIEADRLAMVTLSESVMR